MQCQIYGRAKQEVTGIALEDAREMLNRQYVESRVDGSVLEERLAAYFNGPAPRDVSGGVRPPSNPAEAWHGVMDCLTVH
jgi:hypothetical protein